MTNKLSESGPAASTSSGQAASTSSGQAASTSSGQVLRNLAEEQAACLPEPPETLSFEETRRVLHDLQVHQIELEMQNQELRRTQRELEASQSRYADLYDLAPAGYFTISEQGLILEVNLTAVRLLGVARNNLVRRPFSRFIHPQEKDSYYHHRKQLLATGEPQGCELRLLRKHAAPLWVRYETSRAQNAVGATVCLAVVSDITERKRTEESLLLANERLNLAQRVARFGVWDWDITDGAAVWSTEMFHLFGLDPDTSSASFETWRGILHPDDRAVTAQKIEAALWEHTMLDSNYRIVTPDHQVRWINATGKATYDDSGRPVRMIGICTDITERKDAEEILQTSEEQFRAMFEKHDAVMLLINPITGAIIDANNSAACYYGYDRATLMTINISDLNTLDPEQVKAERLHALHDERNTFIFPHRLAGGEIRMVEVNTSPIAHKGQTILFSIIHDITDRIRAEEQLRMTLAELTRSNEDLQHFAYVASHDLQEPLRMVASFTQLLARRYCGQLDDDAKKFIAYAVEGATRMQQLIEDLLAFSRVESKGRPLESAATGKLLDAAVRNLQTAIEESRAEITHGELPTVPADSSQLIQLFQNLVGNAIKFHRPGEPPRIRVSARNLGQEWQFSVADNGIGVDPRFANRIFVIFQRLHAREQYPGTGIGLAICKRIVERHGGRIWVESTPGVGATFHFTLAALPPNPAPPAPCMMPPS